MMMSLYCRRCIWCAHSIYSMSVHSCSHKVSHCITENTVYVVPFAYTHAYANIVRTICTLEYMHNLSYESKAQRNESRNLTHRETGRSIYLPLYYIPPSTFRHHFLSFFLYFIFQLYVFKHHDTRSPKVRHTIFPFILLSKWHNRISQYWNANVNTGTQTDIN